MPITKDLFKQIIESGQAQYQQELADRAKSGLSKQEAAQKSAYETQRRTESQKELMTLLGVKKPEDIAGVLRKHGLSVHTGEAGTSLGQDPIMRNSLQADRLNDKEVGGYVKRGEKDLSDINQQLSTVAILHKFLDNPNSVNMAEVGIGRARLSEGLRARIQNAVIQKLGNTPTAANEAAKAWDWITGKTKTGVSQDTIDAIRGATIEHQNQLTDDYQSQKDKYTAEAPILMQHVSPEKQQSLVQSKFMPIESKLTQLKPYQEKWAAQQTLKARQQAAAPPPTPQPPRNLFQRMADAWKGSQAPPQQQDMTPSAGSPTIRVRHKQSGAVGTIPPNEFDPNLYDKVQ